MDDRLKDLMRKASKAIEEGYDPFHESFLQKNAVTFDECGAMSNGISLAIDYFLLTYDVPQPGATQAKLLGMAIDAITKEPLQDQHMWEKVEGKLRLIHTGTGELCTDPIWSTGPSLYQVSTKNQAAFCPPLINEWSYRPSSKPSSGR